MNSSTSTRSPRVALSDLRSTLEARRARRAERNQLVRDLESYRSRSDVDDLLAALERDDSPQTEEIRTIVYRNLDRRSSGLGISA